MPLKFSYRFIPFVLSLAFFASCADVSKVTYFNNLQDSVIRKQTADLDPVINKNDIISISVSSLNPEASAVFNAPTMTSSATGASGGGTAGYLVNEDGNVQLPILGQIKVEGLTKRQAASSISKQLTDKKLLVDPIVSVRQLNFHVTVLGDVGHPMVVTVPSEKINILEAIGMAGDLTLTANRDNVLLIREEKGDKIIKRINLNSSNALSSPYYNLKSGDIVYAEPNKSKIRSTSEGRQLLPIVLSIVTVGVVVLDRIIK